MGDLPGPLGWLWQTDLIVAIQGVLTPQGRPAYEALSLLGGSQITLVAVALARWLWGRALALRLLVALFLGIGLDLLIWNVYPTPRPGGPGVWVATPINIASFPSGHLVTVLTLWGTLAAARIIRPVLVALIALLVGLSRLAMGAHFPGDVLSGALIGLALLGVVAWLWPRMAALARRVGWPGTLVAGCALALGALLATPLVPTGRWMLLGLLAGIGPGVALEARYVCFAPPRRAGWVVVVRHLAIGLLGLVPLLLLVNVARDLSFLSQWLAPALAALWIVLGAPLAFSRSDARRARSA